LNETGPSYSKISEDEFGNYTVKRIPEIADAFNYKLINRRNIPYANMLDNLYSATINFRFTESNTVYDDVFLESTFKLGLNAIYEISSAKDVHEFSYENPSVMDYEFNMKNPIQIMYNHILLVFSADMQVLSSDLQVNTNLIIYSCIGSFVCVALIQLGFIVFSNFSIFEQAALILTIPRVECKDREEMAADFVADMRITDFNDKSNDGESHYSFGMTTTNTTTSSSQLLANDAKNKKKLTKIEKDSANCGEREFAFTCKRRMSYIWRSLVFIALMAGYLFILSFIGNRYVGNITDVTRAFNTSARLNTYVMFIENYVRSYYLNPDLPLMNDNSLNQIFMRIDELYSTADNIINVFFDNITYFIRTR